MTRVGVKVQMPQITFTLVTIVRTLVPDEVAHCLPVQITRWFNKSDYLAQFIKSQIYNKIAFSLYSSLLSIQYFELGRDNEIAFSLYSYLLSIEYFELGRDNKIAFSLYSSLLSIEYFELGRDNKIAFSLYSSLLSIQYFELGRSLPSSKYWKEKIEE